MIRSHRAIDAIPAPCTFRHGFIDLSQDRTICWRAASVASTQFVTLVATTSLVQRRSEANRDLKFAYKY
jgi:hypothetical protein